MRENTTAVVEWGVWVMLVSAILVAQTLWSGAQPTEPVENVAVPAANSRPNAPRSSLRSVRIGDLPLASRSSSPK